MEVQGNPAYPDILCLQPVWTSALELQGAEHRALYQERAQSLVPGSPLQKNFTYKYLGSIWHSKLL